MCEQKRCKAEMILPIDGKELRTPIAVDVIYEEETCGYIVEPVLFRYFLSDEYAAQFVKEKL